MPTKYIFPALSAVGALFAFLCPFIPFGAADAMRIVCAVFKGVGAVSLCAFIALALICKKDGHGILQTACAAVIAVAVIASLFMPQIFPAQLILAVRCDYLRNLYKRDYGDCGNQKIQRLPYRKPA